MKEMDKMTFLKICGTAILILIALIFPIGHYALAEDYVAATLYSQPPDPAGGLFQSSWWAPDESNYDEYLYDNFTLPYTQNITAIKWRGGFDPTKISGAGAVVDFQVAIYGTVAGTPDIVGGPLVTYQTGGNAGQSAAGIFGGIDMYDYTFTLPVTFQAQGGIKYWVSIVAEQQGNPDWGFSKATNGDTQYFHVNHDGSVLGFRTGDLAFTLLGPTGMVCGITANTPYALGDLSITITNKGTNLDCVEVSKVPVNHSNAPIGLQTGQYWEINGLQSDRSSTATADFVFNLTLPHSVVPNSNAKVCKYPGGLGGSGWDCDRTGSDDTTVWRNGITGGFSDWAVGDNVTVTALTLVSFTAAETNANLGLAALIISTFTAVVIVWRIWRKKRFA